MSKHTPGPWDYQPGSKWRFPRVLMGPPNSKGRRASLTIKGKKESSIAQGAAGISHEEAEANACLIAVAPDLLAACEKYLAAEQWLVPGGGIPYAMLVDASRAARAAVAKAKGEL